MAMLSFTWRFVAALILSVAPCAYCQTDNVKAGSVLFGKSGCPFCHGPAGMGTERAPSLRGVDKRLNDEQIRHQIHDGGRMMPPFGEALTQDEIVQLSAFLRAKDAWNPVPPPAAK